jgi:hypothetical protein
MTITRLFVATTFAILFGSSAHATDMIQTYDFSGTLAKSIAKDDQVTGWFSIDQTTDSIKAFDFSTPFGPLTGNGGVLLTLHPPGVPGTLADLSFTHLSTSLSTLNLIFDDPLSNGESLTERIETSKRPPIFATADAGCISLVRACGGRDLFSADFTAGALSVAAPAPEPAAWVTLLGGLFMLGAAMRLRGLRIATSVA